MGKKFVIDPITRLEGHGKIHIFFDEGQKPSRTFFQVPDFKGFEKFCEGRAAEEMPALTQKICGVCPTAHHTASVKTLDNLFDVPIPPAAKTIRELMYYCFIYEDHLLHFFFMGGVDFIAGLDAPRDKRNFSGVVERLGADFTKKMLNVRKRVREVMGLLAGSAVYPVFGVAGGVLKPVDEQLRATIAKTADDAVKLAKAVLKLFYKLFLEDEKCLALLNNEDLALDTYSLAMAGKDGLPGFYDGDIRVVDPEGNLFAEFSPEDFAEHLAEKAVPDTYVKPLYLKKIGWKGYAEGKESGVYRVGPLARLNVAERMGTPLAQQAYERMLGFYGKKPFKSIFAYHWARLIEVLHAAERMADLSRDESLTGTHVRNIPPGRTRPEGVGACEAPRGTLFHHYHIDDSALVSRCDLLVATQNNAAAISMAVQKAARLFIESADVTDKQANRVEMAFRAFDPCLACAAHTIEIEPVVSEEEKPAHAP